MDVVNLGLKYHGWLIPSSHLDNPRPVNLRDLQPLGARGPPCHWFCCHLPSEKTSLALPRRLWKAMRPMIVGRSPPRPRDGGAAPPSTFSKTFGTRAGIHDGFLPATYGESPAVELTSERPFSLKKLNRFQREGSRASPLSSYTAAGSHSQGL